MASDTEASAFGGAAQGAATGAQVGGPWGAVIGAVIGGALGWASGKKRKKAKKFAALAEAQRRKQQQMQLAVQRRDIFRQQRLARANAIAAGASDEGVTSSSVLGATASIDAQSRSAVSYFDTQVNLDNAYQMYAKKAGRAQGQADSLMSILGSAGNLATAGADIYGLSKQTQAAPVNTGQYTSFNSTAAQTNMRNNSAFTSFGSSLDL